MTTLVFAPAGTADRAAAEGSRLDRRIWLGGLGVLALLAWVPALASSPGRMPADTKLYLYLDPGRLVGDSIWSFDPRQFAGWVPHQIIAYLWPTGPWYTAAQAIGLPDWVAHRLWLGVIMFAAGSGVAWAARRLGLTASAALAAGAVYQLSPYLVPYISRTSSMLLPWAGLGWIVGLTIGAATRTRWRDAALCALVIASTGNVNATALAMIAPAPVLWLALAAIERTVSWRRAVVAAARIGALAIVTSVWWMAMLVIQGRHGADLLDYSESLEDVSYTTASSEVWRGLGYWLMYIRDAYAPTTTAGADYMTAGRPLVLGFVLLLLGLVGLTVSRFAARRYAIALTFLGVVLAVGVHPFVDPSPIAAFLSGDGESGLVLALRSSTRALPLMTLGLGLGAAALIDALGSRASRPSGATAVRVVGACAVGMIAVGNLPVLTGHRLVDPALERDQYPPDAWYEAAATLDAMPAGYRVLQLPGAEFGAFRWGYTVDPPLPGLTTRPLVTRDLLPLGSPAAMDLLYAFDDRFQSGRAEASTVAPVARLLGADVIWVTGDGAFDRFRTPRPELMSAFFGAAIDSDVGLGPATAFGDPAVNVADIPMVDEQALSNPAVGEPLAPVTLVAVHEPVAVVRATDTTVVMSGSGDGLVDLAAVGLVDGDEAILYSASLTADELVGATEDAQLLVVTDSNRVRAHHWRSSQDVTGYTESGDGSAVIWPDSGDARLVIFPDAPASAFTTAASEGPVTARATSYGDRFSYQPEDRPALAIDGDPNTAWTVLDPTYQYIEVSTDAGIDHLTLLQPDGLTDVRHLRTVTMTVNGGAPIPVTLDGRSLVTGQRVDIEPTDGPTTVRIALGELTAPAPGGRPDRTGVGFAEIDTGLGASPEVVTVPSDMTDAMRDAGIDRPVTYVLTRERVGATDRWRSDPEPTIVRDIDVPFDQTATVDLDVRLDLRAGDAILADLLGIEGPVASARLAGAPAAAGWAAADGDPETAWTTPFGTVVGSRLTVSLLDPGAPLRIRQPGGNHSTITGITVRQSGATAELDVPEPAADGWSTVTLPDGLAAGDLRIEITRIADRTTRDRSYADTVLLPAAISELTNVAPTEVPATFSTECRDDLVAIDGAPLSVRVGGDVAAALAGGLLEATVCSDGGGEVALTAGVHRVTGQQSHRSGVQVDRVVLEATEPQATTSGEPQATTSGEPQATTDDGAAPTATVTDSGRVSRTVEVTDCPAGCWLILGEGYDDGWSASIDGESLGPPTLVSGGFNGWRIPASEGTVTVDIGWTVQRSLNVALMVSALAAVAALVLVIRDRSGRPPPPLVPAELEPIGPSDGIVAGAIAAGAYVAATALFVAPGYWVWGLAGAALVLITRRARIAGYVAIGAMVTIAYDVITYVRREHPAATPSFPDRFEHLHLLGLFAAVSIGVSMLSRPRPDPLRGSADSGDRTP